MNQDQLLNVIRREIALYLTTRGTTRIGLVQSYDKATHAAKVAYQPEGVLSGWLPVGTVRSGNGAGIHFAPNVGDQVMVHFLEGDHDSGVIGMRLYSTADQPLEVPAGQMWIVDDAGTSIKLTNDGNLLISAPGDVSISVTGNLTASVGGDASVDVSGSLTTSADTWSHTGDLSLDGGITSTGDVVANGVSLVNHRHQESGGGETSPPSD